MSRTFPGDFADRAYERFCAKRDREAQRKRAGCANSRTPKSKTKTKQQDYAYHITSEKQEASLKFFQQHGELIQLRRDGRSLQEIADETGDTRLGVFRVFQKAPSNKLKLELGVPT
jgi:hypothetical protein